MDLHFTEYSHDMQLIPLLLHLRGRYDTFYMTALGTDYYSQIIHTLSSEYNVSPKIIEHS